MEYQVLAEFVRVLKIGKNARIEAPLLQYLSIMIQNMDSEHAICKTLGSILISPFFFLSVIMDLGFWEEDYQSYDRLKGFFFFFTFVNNEPEAFIPLFFSYQMFMLACPVTTANTNLWCILWLHDADYCLSNDYINSIIEHQYEFDGGDLAPYYVSFLRF